MTVKFGSDKLDPFVNIQCGKKHIKDKENKKLKTCHPEFFKMYEVKAKFPEESELKIGIWDWDQVGSVLWYSEINWNRRR